MFLVVLTGRCAFVDDVLCEAWHAPYGFDVARANGRGRGNVIGRRGRGEDDAAAWIVGESGGRRVTSRVVEDLVGDSQLVPTGSTARTRPKKEGGEI